jgi:GntR family transcriptional regulator
MLLQIDHHSGVPIYRQIMVQVRRLVSGGQLAAGDQLESVRELSARLKVNPMTISKAYAFLELERLLERRRGVGQFVAKIRDDQKQSLKKEMLDDILGKAAALAVQFDLSLDDVMAQFEKHYHQINRKTGSRS